MTARRRFSALRRLRDALGLVEDQHAKPMFPKARLDVVALEQRWLPSWTATLQGAAFPDPIQGETFDVGRVRISPANGDASLGIALDYYLSASPDPFLPRPALVYHSQAVTVKPVFQVAVASDPLDPVPTQLSATLTFNGTAQTPVTFTTTGHATGDTYLIAVQVASAVTASGNYSWSLAVTATFPGGTPAPKTATASGSLPVAVSDGSANKFGPGWGLAGLDSLSVDAGGVLLLYGAGGARYFSGAGPTYTSPANDFGTLVKNADNTYTYTAPDQVKEQFDTSGRETKLVDTHGLALTYAYDVSSRLSQVATPDGGLTTFNYDTSGYLSTVQEPGARTATITHDATTHDLTTATNPDGGLRTLGYDTGHRLIQEQWLDQMATYAYDAIGLLASVDRGGGATTGLTPQVKQGLTATPAQNASAGVAVVTDALSQLTTMTLDTQGRTTELQTPDGATWQLGRNSAGLVTTQTDPLNRVTTLTYATGTADLTRVDYPDGSNRQYQYQATFHAVTVAIDELGNRTTMAYDSGTGDLLSVTDATNAVTTFTWSVGLLQTVRDAANAVTTFTYDLDRRLATFTNPLGGVTTLLYDPAGNVNWYQDQPGSLGSATLAYDAMRRLVVHTDLLNHTTTNSYNVLGELTEVQDALGHQTTLAYDPRGNLTGVTEAAGTAEQRRLAYAYDVLGYRTAATDGRNDTTSFGYDPVGRLKTVTDALNGVISLGYDLAGRLTTVTDPLGHVTSLAYDVRDRQTAVTDALNQHTTTAYDLAGNVLSVTDAAGHVTSFAYDADNRVVRELDGYGTAEQRTVTMGYDLVGNLTRITDGRGDTTTLTYDAVHRRITTTDPLGHTASVVYDVAGDLTEQIDPAGNTTTLAYDDVHRLTSVTPPAGPATTYSYDAVGDLIQEARGLALTSFAYDNLQRLVQIQERLNPRPPMPPNVELAITTLGYDAADNRTSLIDPDGNQTTYAYDALDRLTTATDPLGHSTTFAYDAASELTSRTDRMGRRIDFTYDDVGQLLTEKWYAVGGALSQTLTFSYDAIGELLTAANAQGTLTYSYDVLGHVASYAQPFGLSLTYSYDAADNRTGVQDSLGGLTTSTYDTANRLTERQFGGTGQVPLKWTISYTSLGAEATVLRYQWNAGLGVFQVVSETDRGYDVGGRLTHLQHQDGLGNNIQNTTYSYDTSGRLGSEQVDGVATTYSYDRAAEFTSDGTNAYSYDANGNRNMTGYSTGTANQTTSDGTWTYSYDAEGNRTKKTKGASAETWTYGYDNLNQLVWVEQRATDGGTLLQRVEYSYDALGHRLSRVVKDGNLNVTETDRYGYDGDNVWADRDGSNNLVMRRLFGDGVDEVMARIGAGGSVAWYLADYRGSVTKVIDGAGTVIDSITYDGFGNVTSESSSANGDRYKYMGREWDAVTGMLYKNGDYYDPAVGKWVGQTLYQPGRNETNPYTFDSNNPMMPANNNDYNAGTSDNDFFNANAADPPVSPFPPIKPVQQPHPPGQQLPTPPVDRLGEIGEKYARWALPKWFERDWKKEPPTSGDIEVIEKMIEKQKEIVKSRKKELEYQGLHLREAYDRLFGPETQDNDYVKKIISDHIKEIVNSKSYLLAERQLEEEEAILDYLEMVRSNLERMMGKISRDPIES